MESDSLQRTLVQVLENYQRCGLKRLETAALPPELVASLSVLARQESAAGASQPETADQAAEIRQPVVSSPAAGTGRSNEPSPSRESQSSSVAPSVSAGPSGDGLIRAGAEWSLPILEIAERSGRFETLSQQASACRKCDDIVSFRQQTVFGAGSLDAQICFMGEAPGADEDRTGQPFVGKAGQLLTKIIGAMKLKREEVYILNALKCRPPQNRTPVPDEIDHCRHFVETQLEVIQPKYIVCLGAVAVRSILQSTLSIGSLRGKFHEYRGAKVVVTYHPSYLLRNESAKRLVWEDMQMLMRELGTLPK